MKIIFDKEKLENLEFENFPVLIDFGFKIISLDIVDLFGFVEDIIESIYELDENKQTIVDVPTLNSEIKIKIVKNNDTVNIYLNGNLIEKTTYSELLNNLNIFFDDIIPYLKKRVLEELKEDEDNPEYVILLGKIYEWKENFYETISFNL